MKNFPLFPTVNYTAELENLETTFKSKTWTQKLEDKFNKDKHALKRKCFDAVCELRKGIQNYIDEVLGFDSLNYGVSTLRTEGRFSFLVYTEPDERGYPMCEVFVEPNGLVSFLYYIRGGFSDNSCHEPVWMNGETQDLFADAYYVDGKTQSLAGDEVCRVVEKTAACFQQWFHEKSRRISSVVYQITPSAPVKLTRTLVFDPQANTYVAGEYKRIA
ncbi:MAG: hypothetical protein KA052_02570 [Candidatus Pacebacteria bacterium]|nr:hypothetical protein [Candidatus Paceibacterota bacterium]